MRDALPLHATRREKPAAQTRTGTKANLLGDAQRRLVGRGRSWARGDVAEQQASDYDQHARDRAAVKFKGLEPPFVACVTLDCHCLVFLKHLQQPDRVALVAAIAAQAVVAQDPFDARAHSAPAVVLQSDVLALFPLITLALLVSVAAAGRDRLAHHLFLERVPLILERRICIRPHRMTCRRAKKHKREV